MNRAVTVSASRGLPARSPLAKDADREGEQSMTTAGSLQPPETPPRSRWRERLRGWTLLAVLIAVLAIPIYGVYCLSEMIALQPNIEKAGGSVQLEVVGPQWLKDWAGRDYVWLVGTPVDLNAPQRQRVDDRWLKQVRRMTSLRSLGLQQTQITDRGIASLVPLAELEYLGLSDTAIGDAGLEHIRGLTRITNLSLDGTQVTDDGLECLVEMTKMISLDLSRTTLRGPGLKHLADMKNLWWLNLDSTQLDDEGLAQLPVLPSLQCLQLEGTKITNSSLRGLSR